MVVLGPINPRHVSTARLRLAIFFFSALQYSHVALGALSAGYLAVSDLGDWIHAERES